MAISNSSRGLTPGVCTSTTRPTAPYEGQLIYETDTDRVLVWNNSAWVASIEPRDRNVTDESGVTHILLEDMCNDCIEKSTLLYTEAELRAIYKDSSYAPLKIIR